MREQQVPPHDGGVVVDAPQTTPFGVHCVAPGADTASPHRPTAAPACFAQLPPQQSVFVAQTSPCWVQNEASPHSPLLQKPEQQSAGAAQALPVVLQVVLSGLHTPPPVPFGAHVPPQHSSFCPQAWLSETHCFVAHFAAMHDPVQHSGPAVHAAPGAVHEPAIGSTHRLFAQLAVQHSALVAHAPPVALHSGASARDESMMASMKLPPSVFAPSPPPSAIGAGVPSDSLPHPAATFSRHPAAARTTARP